MTDTSRHRADTPFDPQAFLRQLTTRPGVYRMIGAGGTVLYVGKARNLRKRVASYFLRQADSPKTRALVQQIRDVQVSVTQTEDEALVLENNLIKAHRPRYNVLLRDDKSYPYLFISGNHEFPRLAFHRGNRRAPGRYFGPYPNAGAVREMQGTLHRLFRIRQCDDSFFAHRSRPCLQYQIKRCTAPCVGLVSTEDYRHDVQQAVRLLEGGAEEVLKDLIGDMEQASAKLDFERAAQYREQIALIRRLQDQPLSAGGSGNYDLVCGDIRDGLAGVVVTSVRNGMNFGHRAFFPRAPAGTEPGELLASFLGQHYLAHTAPSEILIDRTLADRDWLQHALTAHAGRKVVIVRGPRGSRARLLEMTRATLQQALNGKLLTEANAGQKLAALQKVLGLPELPQHIECFDISHTRGEKAVASCVVFIDGVAEKANYRYFNIEGIEPGDDYAAIRQAISRRFDRLRKGEGKMPGLLLIDGGAGQLAQGVAALKELGVENVRLAAVAKGPSRRPGLEAILLPGRKSPLILPADSPALHLIQQIRDEAHRFAIGGHRRRREKARTQSMLDGIAGLGAVRKQELLKALGGVRQIARSSVSDLARVDGISTALAQRIYDYFHDQA